MSERGHVFVNSGESVAETARMLAGRLGAKIARHASGQRVGAIYLSRQSFTGAAFVLTIAVAENEVFGITVDDEDDALYAYFEMELEIQARGLERRADQDVVRHETARVFEETVDLGWPSADVEIGGFAYSAWSPELGRTDFPPGTSFGASSRATWRAYVTRDRRE